MTIDTHPRTVDEIRVEIARLNALIGAERERCRQLRLPLHLNISYQIAWARRESLVWVMGDMEVVHGG